LGEIKTTATYAVVAFVIPTTNGCASNDNTATTLDNFNGAVHIIPGVGIVADAIRLCCGTGRATGMVVTIRLTKRGTRSALVLAKVPLKVGIASHSTYGLVSHFAVIKQAPRA
jgi:hypothetical protein